MNNTDIRSVYGLKYNPFVLDVPPEALHTIPGTEHFAARKPWPHRAALP